MEIFRWQHSYTFNKSIVIFSRPNRLQLNRKHSLAYSSQSSISVHSTSQRNKKRISFYRLNINSCISYCLLISPIPIYVTFHFPPIFMRHNYPSHAKYFAKLQKISYYLSFFLINWMEALIKQLWNIPLFMNTCKIVEFGGFWVNPSNF